MAIDLFLVITDNRGAVLAGESSQSVYNPYTRATVTQPVEIGSFEGMTEQTYAFGSGTGTGAGKIVFDPLTVDKYVDSVSQATFLAQATGVAWKFVDLLLVRSTGDGSAPKPFMSYRLGTVGISQIAPTSADDAPRERVSFVFGQLQIGYQAQKPDGSYAPFLPVGWDLVRNARI